MQYVSMDAIRRLPQANLGAALLKGSMRMVKYLIIGHPQAVGATLLDSLVSRVSPATFRRLTEEISECQILTPEQIRSAETEFFKILYDEKLIRYPQAS